MTLKNKDFNSYESQSFEFLHHWKIVSHTPIRDKTEISWDAIELIPIEPKLVAEMDFWESIKMLFLRNRLSIGKFLCTPHKPLTVATLDEIIENKQQIPVEWRDEKRKVHIYFPGTILRSTWNHGVGTKTIRYVPYMRLSAMQANMDVSRGILSSSHVAFPRYSEQYDKNVLHYIAVFNENK